MALTEQVVMPGSDYKAICDATRTLSGTTAILKSGEVAGKILGCKPQTNKAITITSNGTTTITPDLPFTSMSKVDVAVNVAGSTGGGLPNIDWTKYPNKETWYLNDFFSCMNGDAWEIPIFAITGTNVLIYYINYDPKDHDAIRYTMGDNAYANYFNNGVYIFRNGSFISDEDKWLTLTLFNPMKEGLNRELFLRMATKIS